MSETQSRCLSAKMQCIMTSWNHDIKDKTNRCMTMMPARITLLTVTSGDSVPVCYFYGLCLLPEAKLPVSS